MFVKDQVVKVYNPVTKLCDTKTVLSVEDGRAVDCNVIEHSAIVKFTDGTWEFAWNVG